MKKSLPLKKKILASLIRTAVVATLTMPAMSWAQSSDASLRGKAAANAEVTAKNVATGLVRRTTAGADGGYALVGLPPGTYQVDAGPGTEKTVTLTVASTANLDLAAAGGGGPAQLEGITVTASSATLTEVKTSEIGTNVSLYQIRTTPQITRNFLEFADATPGVIFNVQNNKTQLQGGVQNASAINVYIDGVGQKNFVKGGGVTGQSGSGSGPGTGDPGNPFPQLAIGEYKVITSNYKAEYDQISSVGIVAATKSGGNEFHGEVYGNYTDQNYRSATPAEQASGEGKAVSATKEYGFEFEGPIIQDVAHFLFTYEAKRFNTPATVAPPSQTFNGQTYDNFLPADIRAQFGPTSQPFNEDLYFGKVDWALTDRDRLELEWLYRGETQIAGGSGNIAKSAAYNYNNDDSHGSLKWVHSADAWTNELMLTHKNTRDEPIVPPLNNPGQVYTWRPNDPSSTDIIRVNGQDPRNYFSDNQKENGIKDDLTFNSFSWNGDHVIKTGFKYNDVKLSARDSSTAAVYYYGVTPDGGTDTIPFQAVYGKTSYGLPLTSLSTNKQYGFYIQDDWTVNDHLTLNLGVRYDYEKSPGFLNYQTRPDVVAGFSQPYPDPAANGMTYAQVLALGGININDYISNGHNRSAQSNEWQPRLGFSYDLNGDEEHVIFGGAARAYDRNLFSILSLETSKNALAQPSVYFKSSYNVQSCSLDAPTTDFCVPWDPKYLDPANLQALGGVGGEPNLFNNKIKAPYSNQFSLGMRNKVGDWNTSVTLTHIVSKDGIVGHLGNRYADGSFYDAGGNQWGAPGVPGVPGNLVLWDNGKETRNNQVLISFDKPYTKDSGWSANIAYTYTNGKQNRDYTDNYAFDMPTVQDYPFTTSQNVPKHRLVAIGSKDIPWDITLSAKLTLETRRPFVNIIGCDGNPDSNCGAATPNGYGGFYTQAAAMATDGHHFLFGGPIFGYREIDLQASKNWDLTRGMVLQARIDILNALNYKNYANDIWNYPTLPVYDRTKNGDILGVPRTFKFSLDFKF
jgi:outer membrane receptor protein involved in Fe transport